MSPSEELVSFRGVPAGLPRGEVRAFARLLREQVALGRTFHCLIAGDPELRGFNRRFLGHDYATDVLSFPSESGAGLGDMAISAGRAAAQAREYGHSRLDEIRLLMLHGLLHLKGMDHQSD